MPYKLSEDKLSVLKDDGTLVKKHNTPEEALAHLRALMANVPDAKGSMMSSDTVTLLISKREDVSPKEGESKYGDVKFADAKNNKYPIDTEEHIRAAWNYINKEGNASKYDPAEVETIKSHIIAAWKSKIDKAGPPSAENHAMYIVDEFVVTQVGDPYRLLPFGKISKNGKTHFVTPESAAQFKLPEFKPAIKLGSHDETTASGGSIVKLEVRSDGLYAYPEFTAKGARAVTEGDYRYHSPEILWEDGAIETNNGWTNGPLIVGDALLHTPHLGESAALYTAQITQGENQMQEEFKVPKDVFENLRAFFSGKKPDPTPEPVIPEEYKTAMKERDDLKAKQEKLQAEIAHKAQIEKLTAEIQNKERFGVMFSDAKFAGEAAEMFSTMNDTQREWTMRKFAAMQAQIDFTKLTAEFGTVGNSVESNPVDEFAALIVTKQKEAKLDYAGALRAVRMENPEMASAYDAEMKRRAKE